MAFSLSFTASTNYSTFSSNKSSNILEYNKTNLTTVLNQIHIPKSGKCKVRNDHFLSFSLASYESFLDH